MEIMFFFKNMQKAEEEMLQDYLSKKIQKIEKMLSHLPPDGVKLQVKGEKFKKHSAYEVEYTLKMGKETLVATEASHMITKAVDLALDRLDIQLKKKTEETRRGHRGLRARTKLTMRVPSLQ